MFMKTGIITVLIACALTLSGVSSGVAQAAPRPSGKCEQVGAKKIFKNQTFVCTKRGKKLIWVKKTPRPSKPDAVPASNTESTDPVTAKIDRMMASLPMPNQNAPMPPMRFILENPGDQEFLPRLEKQFLYLAQAFPEMNWSKTGVTFIPRTPNWLANTMREQGCPERVVQRIMGYYSTHAYEWGTGVMDCNPDFGPTAVMGLNLGVGAQPGFMWDMLVSQEFSEPIRSTRFALNPIAINSPHPIGWWDVNMPSWMREGVEPIWNSIATAMQTRKWEPIRLVPFYLCGTGVLRDYAPMLTGWDCHYILGTEAVELMVALYGWDAPATWWGSFGDQRDPYVAFKNAYGDDYDTFERYASEFFQWRANKVPMSTELLNRLG
jgi:hypothetical protein